MKILNKKNKMNAVVQIIIISLSWSIVYGILFIMYYVC